MRNWEDFDAAEEDGGDAQPKSTSIDDFGSGIFLAMPSLRMQVHCEEKEHLGRKKNPMW